MPLARPAGIRVGHPHRKRRGRRGVQPATARREHASARIQDRPAAHAAPRRRRARGTMHRGPLRLRVRGRTGRRRRAPFSGHAESLDAADRAVGARGARRAGRPAAAEGPGVLARFLRAELAGPAQGRAANTAIGIRRCWSSAAATPAFRLPRASRSAASTPSIVDRGERVGDNWRKRYHALTLHNQVYVNHLPYMPFPPNWPVYIPKDKLANWFESYAEAMELNYWTGNRVRRAAPTTRRTRAGR